MTRNDGIVAVVVAVLGGGTLAKLLEPLTGRRKARADTSSSLADAAEKIAQAAAATTGAQDDVIERLQQRTHQLGLEVENLQKAAVDARALERALTSQIAELHEENRALRESVARLEHLVEQLTSTRPS